MSFSYGFEKTTVNLVRLLIADTQATPHVFEDEEIENAAYIIRSNFQSGMFYSGRGGIYQYPDPPTAYLRTAAILLDALASNKARLANALKVLDVQINTQSAAQELRASAQQYRDTDDNAGAFMIAEQVSDVFSFRERFWKTVQRQSAQ